MLGILFSNMYIVKRGQNIRSEEFMSGSMSRNKGQRGEREVIKMLQPIVDKVYAELGREAIVLERNLIQSWKGGSDIAGIGWLALEVKYQETTQLEVWWRQAYQQALDRAGNLVREPVLIYRKNNVAWEVVMLGYLEVGLGLKVRTRVRVSTEAFLIWFEKKLKAMLTMDVE